MNDAKREPWSDGLSPSVATSDGDYRIREAEARLDRRIATLEGRSGPVRWAPALAAAAFVFGLCALVVAMRAGSPGPGPWSVSSVSAEAFVLRDADGIERGRMALGSDGRAHLALADREGRERIRLTVLADGSPGVTVMDANDRPRAVLGSLPDGTTNLVFADAQGIGRAVLGLEPDGSSQALFTDRVGTVRALVGVGATGAPVVSTFSGAPQEAPEP
jgi:hypothetical protein